MEGRKAEEAISSGLAFEKMKEWFSAQGGDVSMLDHTELLPMGVEQTVILAEEDGFLSEMEARLVGLAAGALGAGRKTKEDSVDFGAGIVLVRQCGDAVKKGEVIARLYSSHKDKLAEGERIFRSALRYGASRPKTIPLVYEIVV